MDYPQIKHVYQINHDENLRELEQQAEITFLDDNHIDKDILRSKRDFNFNLEVDSDGDEHEISAEAIGNLFRSNDGKTRLDGTVGYSQKFGSAESGNPRVNGKLNLQIAYK